jgi:hypothetical protein
MTEPLPDYKRRALERQRDALLEEHKAAINQLTQTLSAADQTKIKRQIADLEEKIQEVERQLGREPAQTDQDAERPAPTTTTPPGASPAASKSGLGGWFSRLPDAGKAAVITGLFAVIVALIYGVADMIPRLSGPTPTPTPMIYVTRVEGQNSAGTTIKDAKVTLEVPGRPPLDAYTDSNGVATIIVPAQYVGGSAVMIVEAPGFTTFRQNISIDAGTLPPLVRLSPLQQP